LPKVDNFWVRLAVSLEKVKRFGFLSTSDHEPSFSPVSRRFMYINKHVKSELVILALNMLHYLCDHPETIFRKTAETQAGNEPGRLFGPADYETGEPTISVRIYRC
jgi:hypothetical protein